MISFETSVRHCVTSAALTGVGVTLVMPSTLSLKDIPAVRPMCLGNANAVRCVETDVLLDG